MPKRNARRAVTRSLLKRQMRNAVLRRIDPSASASASAAGATAAMVAAVPVEAPSPAVADAATASLRAGLWVVRLRAPFDRSRYPSAASDALRVSARAELDAVLQRAARKALSPGGRGSGWR